MSQTHVNMPVPGGGELWRYGFYITAIVGVVHRQSPYGTSIELTCVWICNEPGLKNMRTGTISFGQFSQHSTVDDDEFYRIT